MESLGDEKISNSKYELYKQNSDSSADFKRGTNLLTTKEKWSRGLISVSMSQTMRYAKCLNGINSVRAVNMFDISLLEAIYFTLLYLE